jgi:hypothetical protein
MGHFSQIPPLSFAYPGTIRSLGNAERTFVHAVRGWVAGHRQGGDPLPHLCKLMRSAGVSDAAFYVDRLIAVIARTARRTVAIRCQHCPYLSDDESCLLRAASLAQAGKSALAKAVLRNTLLSLRGAEFAVGPLEDLGQLFAEARLIFCPLPVPGVDSPSTDAVEAWLPPQTATAASLN